MSDFYSDSDYELDEKEEFVGEGKKLLFMLCFIENNADLSDLESEPDYSYLDIKQTSKSQLECKTNKCLLFFY